MSINLEPYLACSRIVDWQHTAVLAKADQLKVTSRNELALIEASFNYVRDEITHIDDAAEPKITLKASEVFAAQTGYCYAKSHLLAALLRANGIPAGFSYQRISLGDGRFCLHGLNSVYLRNIGWHKVDARGNTNEINTYFKPPKVSQAFDTDRVGEQESVVVYDAPLSVVITALESHSSVQQMDQNLPDLNLIG